LVGGSLYHNIEGNLDGCAANSLLGAAIKSPDTLPCGLPWVTKYDRRADHDVQGTFPRKMSHASAPTQDHRDRLWKRSPDRSSRGAATSAGRKPAFQRQVSSTNPRSDKKGTSSTNRLRRGPKRDAHSMVERCDLVCPDLPKVL